MILKIWPLCKRSLTFILFSPLSWQRHIVWISCNRLFYSSWLEEEFEIYFNLIGVFLSFIPIYPLTFDFKVNMVFEKMPGMFISKFRPSSAFWYMNFQILIKYERVYRSPYTIPSGEKKKNTRGIWTVLAGGAWELSPLNILSGGRSIL